jgi:hypothetical protein
LTRPTSRGVERHEEIVTLIRQSLNLWGTLREQQPPARILVQKKGKWRIMTGLKTRPCGSCLWENNAYAATGHAAASSCAQLDHSCDPASGTFLGYDGRRHDASSKVSLNHNDDAVLRLRL